MEKHFVGQNGTGEENEPYEVVAPVEDKTNLHDRRITNKYYMNSIVRSPRQLYAIAHSGLKNLRYQTLLGINSAYLILIFLSLTVTLIPSMSGLGSVGLVPFNGFSVIIIGLNAYCISYGAIRLLYYATLIHSSILGIFLMFVLFYGIIFKGAEAWVNGISSPFFIILYIFTWAEVFLDLYIGFGIVRKLKKYTEMLDDAVALGGGQPLYHYLPDQPFGTPQQLTQKIGLDVYNNGNGSSKKNPRKIRGVKNDTFERAKRNQKLYQEGTFVQKEGY